VVTDWAQEARTTMMIRKMVKFFIGSDFMLIKAIVKIRPAWLIVISKNADFFSKYPCGDYAEYVTDCFTGCTKNIVFTAIP